MNYKLSREVLFSLYWDEFKSIQEISWKLKIKWSTVKKNLEKLNIPIRTRLESTKLTGNGGRRIWTSSDGKKSHWNLNVNGVKRNEGRFVLEKSIGRRLKRDEDVHHKDFYSLNNHPRNLEVTLHSNHFNLQDKMGAPERIPLYEVYLRMAEQIAGRSTCIRLKTGSIITSEDLTKVYSMGFNGGIKRGPNSCNGIEGNCGCLHSEENAILKVSVSDENKVLFCTHSPCFSCTKKIIQSGFIDVFYRNEYRDIFPIKILHYYGIRTCKYDVWKNYEEELKRRLKLWKV